jgi:hypothetical protein
MLFDTRQESSMSNITIRALALAALLSAGSAQAFSIDGNLSDWGIQRTGHASDWTPNSSVAAYVVEDQTGGLNTYLNPGYGGQAYDAEAIYVAFDANNLYIAIATGQNPNTPNIFTAAGDSYGPGDIAIDFGANGSFDYGIELLGSTKTTAGHVYSNVNWGLGLWKSNGAWTGYYDPNAAGNRALANPAHPTSILSGADVGTGTVAYTTIGQNNYGIWPRDLHFFYEVSVPLSSFGADWANGTHFDVHWTQNCANDSILVDPPVGHVPEPGTLALLPLGMIGLVVLRRKKSAA